MCSRDNLDEQGMPKRADVSRMQAFFKGKAYAPHRHDTYTIGLTLAGVQSFDYRGSVRHSRPGGLFILHPDELHDGRAGTEDGFGYRAINIKPGAIQNVLGGKSLPFIAGGLSSDIGLQSIVSELLDDLDTPLGELAYDNALFDLATRLDRLAGGYGKATSHDLISVQRARDYLCTHWDEVVSMEDLERETGQSRWSLSRDFRALLGTSPYRYLVLRRLDRAREMIASGNDLADTAYACCFADQSHLNRQFKRAFGLTPKAWRDFTSHGNIHPACTIVQ